MKRLGMSSWFDTICEPFVWVHGSQITPSLRPKVATAGRHHERILFFFMSISVLLLNPLGAVSVDGTSSTQYKSTVQIFRRGLDEYVRGFARLGNGFAIASRASGFMDTNISVSGQMDLGETGTLILLNNLYFERNITLTSGGNIKGKATVSGDARTIFLGGDMTLSATTYSRVLHITGDWSNSGTSGDLIIDGRGHTLDIQDRAQIFVDTNVTLTLRNMTIRTGAKSLMTPPIRLASSGSKLTLDNVMFDLGADFQFKQGQIFVHNEVAVTGTSAFVYQSPMPSYITSGATWSFEYGTTFSVAPATFTDCPFTVNNTYTNNNFIVLADASSVLYLNSCSFKTTYTGLRVTKGMVLFDNRVAVDTMAGMDLLSTGTAPVVYIGATPLGGSDLSNAVWSPDGRFIAVISYTSNQLQLLRFNGTGAPILLRTITTVSGPRNLVWSSDGRFLALVGLSSNMLQIFRFDGQRNLIQVGSSVATGTSPKALAWSPDGRFLVVGKYDNSGGNAVRVYRFDGVSSPVLIASAPASASDIWGVSWSPDGRFIAEGNLHSQGLEIFQFNGINTLTRTGFFGLGTSGQQVTGTAWSPDGRYIAFATDLPAQVYVCKFTGRGKPVQVGVASIGAYSDYVSWSPDGRFIAVTPSTFNLNIYKLGNTSALEQVGNSVTARAGANSQAWSSDGKFIAVPCSAARMVEIYRCNYYFTGQPTQSFASGLVFGDSAKGSGYNANVKVLTGAGVTLQGKVTDDSA